MRNSYKGKVTMGMPKFEGQEVMVVSQFNQPKLLKVEKPKKLCNPIDKNDEGIINPDTHLWRASTGQPVRHLAVGHKEGSRTVCAVRENC